MKKSKIKNLAFTKKTISDFNSLKAIGGVDPDHTCRCPSHSICPPGIYCY